MNPMKRLGLVALLVVGVMLLANTSARAKPGADNWGSIPLENVSGEPNASGQASLTNVRLLSIFVSPSQDPDPKRGFKYSGRLSVKCQNLTPGSTYWTPAGTFTADRKGNGDATGNVVFLITEWYGYIDGVYGVTWLQPYVVDVARLNADGSTSTVLTGDFLPPGL